MIGQLQVHHADRIKSALMSDAAAKSALVASWQRSSALHHLDPGEYKSPQRVSEAELSIARQKIEPLIAVAQSSLDRLYVAVGGVGCCVLLADTDGIPVERRGAPVDDETFQSWGLWTGSIWSEDSEGTNGIGTCIVEQRALTIHRDQHFLTRNTALSCTTAPIYDHEGNLVAALDVSSCRSDLTEGFANLISIAVTDAAKRIEAENFRISFPDARILLAPTIDRSVGALVAVDADDLVIGATRSARQMLGITPDCLKRALPAATFFGNDDKRESFTQAERSVLQRALSRAGGNISAAAHALGISRSTLHRKLKRLDVARPN